MIKKNKKTITIAALFGVGLLAGEHGLQTAYAQVSSKAAMKSSLSGMVPLTYRNGQTVETIHVAPNEIAVISRGGSRLDNQMVMNSLKSSSSLELSVKKSGSGGETIFEIIDKRTQKSSLPFASAFEQLTKIYPDAEIYNVAYSSGDTQSKETPHLIDNRFTIQVDDSQDIANLESKYGLKIAGKVDWLAGTYIVEVDGRTGLEGIDTANRILENEKGIVFATPLIKRQMSKKFTPNDLLFSDQWHLKNTGGNAVGAVAGNDVNIEGAWDFFKGTGINIGIVDDGVPLNHPDLNARSDIDIDINFGDDDASPDLPGDGHGTAVAGVAAARGNNALGVAGAAFEASVVGIRMISAGTTDNEESVGLKHRVDDPVANNVIHVSNNSWGPFDAGYNKVQPGPLAAAALEYGVTNGRGGKGTIYMWAAGNGRCANDNVNYDGYASSRYTIAVGATGPDGTVSYYGEPGASMLINAPSSDGTCNNGASEGITTTDRVGSAGYSSIGDYTTTFGGTSSSTPLAAGVVALMLDANPNLTWRDVQHILVETSTRNHPESASWFQNGADKWFSHDFGYGRVNASAAVGAAANWELVPGEAAPVTATANFQPAVAIPDNNIFGVTRTLDLSAPNNFITEALELRLTVPHTFRGDLRVELTSPDGTTSILAEPVSNDSGPSGYANWVFTSMAHWGENPSGTWTLKVADTLQDDIGTLNSFTVTAYGFIKDGVITTPTPTPTPTPGNNPPIDTLSYNFDSSSGFWFPPQQLGSFDSPVGSYETGSIRMVPANNTNTFGFWESQVFSINPPAKVSIDELNGLVGDESLYRADWQLFSDQADPANVPTLRTRVSTSDFQQSNLLVITSVADGAVSPSSLGHDYNQYFTLPDNTTGLRLNFDMLNFDPTDSPTAMVALDGVDVSSLKTSYLSNPQTILNESYLSNQVHGFNADFNPAFEAPFIMPSAKGLMIQGAETKTGTIFGVWTKEVDHALQANKLYLIRFVLGSDATEEQKHQLATFRLRMNSSSFKYSAYLNVDSVNAGARLPTASSTKIYDVYFVAPPEIVGEKPIISFDFLDVVGSGNDQTIPVYLRQMGLVTYNIP